MNTTSAATQSAANGQAKKDDGDPKESWAAVQDEMYKHDLAMVKDYAEDIDNLLVFAGLFSATLTAFLAESYTMLQEDNSETSKQLLVRISTQLESFKLGSDFLNSTSVPPLPTIPIPSRAAVWINSLWFLSLIFALSAAFLGIRVRQWLREYMRWNDTLAKPQENVLVRQVRYESLSSWKVLGSISCIPALLESALVLFMSGIVILAFTLDPTLAVVVSIAVALLMASTLIITVLPLCSKRCPYRSPTAWACLLLWIFIRDTLALYFWRQLRARWLKRRNMELCTWKMCLQLLVDRDFRETSWTSERPRSWRQRDIKSVKVEQLRDARGELVDAKSVLDGEVAAEIDELDLRVHGERLHPCSIGNRQELMYDMGYTLWLFRALVWVMQSSQDPKVHRHAVLCTKNIHPYGTRLNTEVTYYPAVWPSSYFADLYLLTRFWQPDPALRSNPSYPTLATFSSMRKHLKKGFKPCPRVSTSNGNSSGSTDPCDHGLRLRGCSYFPRTVFSAIDNIHNCNMTEAQEKLLAHILAADILDLATRFLPFSGKSPGYEPAFTMSGTRRVYELLAALQCFTNGDTSTGAILEPLLQLHNSFLDFKDRDGFNMPGLTPSIDLLIQRSFAADYYRYELNDDGRYVDLSEKTSFLEFRDVRSGVRRRKTAEDLYNLRLRCATIFYNRSLLGDMDDMHHFVTAAHFIFHSRPSGDTSLPELLEQMATVAEVALERSYMNCGYVMALPWFQNTRWLDVALGGVFVPTEEPIDSGPTLFELCSPNSTPFAHLIDALHRSSQQNLLTGQIRWKLPYLRALTAVPPEVLGSDETVEAWIATVPIPDVGDLLRREPPQELLYERARDVVAVPKSG